MTYTGMSHAIQLNIELTSGDTRISNQTYFLCIFNSLVINCIMH